jgi:hypothetical protein
MVTILVFLQGKRPHAILQGIVRQAVTTITCQETLSARLATWFASIVLIHHQTVPIVNFHPLGIIG